MEAKQNVSIIVVHPVTTADLEECGLIIRGVPTSYKRIVCEALKALSGLHNPRIFRLKNLGDYADEFGAKKGDIVAGYDEFHGDDIEGHGSEEAKIIIRKLVKGAKIRKRESHPHEGVPLGELVFGDGFHDGSIALTEDERDALS